MVLIPSDDWERIKKAKEDAFIRWVGFCKCSKRFRMKQVPDEQMSRCFHCCQFIPDEAICPSVAEVVATGVWPAFMKPAVPGIPLLVPPGCEDGNQQDPDALPVPAAAFPAASPAAAASQAIMPPTSAATAAAQGPPSIGCDQHSFFHEMAMGGQLHHATLIISQSDQCSMPAGSGMAAISSASSHAPMPAAAPGAVPAVPAAAPTAVPAVPAAPAAPPMCTSQDADGLWHCQFHLQTFEPECLVCKWCLAQQDLSVNCVSLIYSLCVIG